MEAGRRDLSNQSNFIYKQWGLLPIDWIFMFPSTDNHSEKDIKDITSNTLIFRFLN